jgi:hypothetical protein
VVTENREKWGWESGGVRVMPTPEQMARADALLDQGEPDDGASESFALRGRAAAATLALHQIGTYRLEFGFNPGQRRGPDGRWIKMGGIGSAGKGGLPKGSGLKNPRTDAGGKPLGDAPTQKAAPRPRAESPGRAIAKRNYTNGDRVPLADGTTGTVVGGHHQVAGRPGMYVAVRPDGGGKLREVAVDAIRKRQVREAERSGTTATDEHGVAEGTRAADLRDAQAERIQASKASPDDTVARAEAAAAERRAAAAARDAAAEASKRETEQARARVIARGAEKAAQGPPAAGFTPMADKDWNMLQKRLGKRTPRLDPDGELNPGDIVPTRDGKWQEVLGPDPAKFYERNGMVGIKVRDDAKGYVHGEDAASIKKRIEAYAAEKAWRDSGGSKDRLDGNASAPVDQETGRRPGEPPLGEDGKYAKPTKQYAVHNGQVYTRTSRNPYRYASVVSFRDPSHPDAEGRHDAVWSWHRTAEAAAKGTLTSDQRRGLYVSKVLETSFEDPKMGNETATDAPASTVAPQSPTAQVASAPLSKNSTFIHRGEAVTVTGRPYWDSRENTWVAPVRNSRGVGQRIAVGGDRQSGPLAPQAAAASVSAPTRAELDDYSRRIESAARMVRNAIVDEEGPFWMDKYKERELSDRLQELVDARDAGQTDKIDRITEQIRKILRDTDTQTEDELPARPGGAR